MNAPLQETLCTVRRRLLEERRADGGWTGELSTSALATATAVIALALADRARHQARIRRGLAWLAAQANADGGWGDTTRSLSNISTTTLVWAAYGLLHEPAPAAERWLGQEVARWTGGAASAPGAPDPMRLTQAIAARYGADRTFSVPILTACALCGRLGAGPEAWARIPALPFELARLPARLFKWLRLPVVSYALPALIAIGQVRHHHRPPTQPWLRGLRDRARAGTLRELERIQPASGGYLEAIPLTSFVVMSLAGMGLGQHAIAHRGVAFLERTQQPDGGWPIDVNLSTWVTTLAINALAAGGALPDELTPAARHDLLQGLLRHQHRTEHPFTHAAPGGWAWTDLSGGVPDADDTAGALLAIRHLTLGSALQETRPQAASSPLHGQQADVQRAAMLGLGWLLDLQNHDGGMPTFCRGWGALPFDRSTPELTAHALRAVAAWRSDMPPALQRRTSRFTRRALRYLARAQRADGSWAPLWFGNQHAPAEENPTYGTAQVLLGLQALGDPSTQPLEHRAIDWLLQAQGANGGWGGAPQTPPSIEETALAVRALAAVPQARPAVERGCDWLIAATRQGQDTPAAPIGLYFARLWYFERIYPLIHLTAALARLD